MVNSQDAASDASSDSSSSQAQLTLREKISNWLKTPSASHVLIIALLGSAGGGLAVPQETPILREFACDYLFNRKYPFPPPGEEYCQNPDVAKMAGEILTSARIFNALLTIICLTFYSDLLVKFGRKPMFAFSAFCLTCSIFLFGMGALFRGPIGVALIVGNFIFSGIGSQPLLQLCFQSYIVDCVKDSERSPTFAMLAGCTFGGLAVSAIFSSFLVSSGMPLLPFWVGAAIFFTMFLYCVIVLPEAMTAERQEELRDANAAATEGQNNSNGDGDADDSEDEHETGLQKFLHRINFLKRLYILLPHKSEDPKKGRDYRLFVLSIAFVLYRVAEQFDNELLLLTTTGTFGFSGADNGILVGFVTASKAILLLGLLPIVIRVGRTKYVKWNNRKSSVRSRVDGLSESARLLLEPDEEEDREAANGDAEGAKKGDGDEKPEGAQKFDLYFGAFSFVVDAIALAAVGLSTKVWQLYASTALLSISAAGGPSLQGICTQVTSKAMSDATLSALALLENLSSILSPLVLGGIYSATAKTMPSLAWFVAAALFASAGLVMLLTPARPARVDKKSKRQRRKDRAEAGANASYGATSS